MALEHSIDETRDSVTILERCKRGRPLCHAWTSVGDVGIDVANYVRKCICPSFLVTTGKMGVGSRRRSHQRWVLGQQFVRRIATSNPQFVLLFLTSAEGCVRGVQFNPEVVLVASAYLADLRAAAGAVVESHEDGRQILTLDAKGLERVGGIA